jgi:hypothetical protein
MVHSDRFWSGLGAGVAGAVTVTALNEAVRRTVPHAPRMEVIGMRALAGAGRKVGRRPPPPRRLFLETLAGDLVSNGIYYSLAAAGSRRNVWRRGALLGLAAGVGAALLPPYLGLGHQPGERQPLTQAMTVAWYLAGGLAAAAAAALLLTEPSVPDEG